MSIAAMNWALSQRLETHQQQILLYVIADSADPSGVTRHCDPDYMVDRARLSRATMFRRLGELEELGVLARRKYYTEEGAPRYEIRCNLDVRIDLPIRTRKTGDDDGASEGEDDAGAIRPESQAETLVAATKVSPVRPAQSHSCDYVSPPLSEGLPPNPPPGGDRSKKEAEQGEKRDSLWRLFLGAYPSIAAMDQQAARAELDALSLDDTEWAVSVAPAYAAECRKVKKPPKNAHIWLRKGMFKNFAKAKIEPPPPDAVWITEGSTADLALRFVRNLARAPQPFVSTRADGVRGYRHKTDVGDDLLAMLAFIDEVPLRWPSYPRGSQEFASWQERFVSWIGQGFPTEPGSDVIRAPCQWPPNKRGTIYRDENSTAEEEKG